MGRLALDLFPGLLDQLLGGLGSGLHRLRHLLGHLGRLTCHVMQRVRGNAGELLGEPVQQATGCRMVHVVFPGDPQLRTAVLGKQVDCMGLNLGAVTATPPNTTHLRVPSSRSSGP